ncbi:MAG: hypothetical protein HY263_03805 [Chloroflexi bacterium]|nr:hypothetical protein [Chloroflexota bacterium]
MAPHRTSLRLYRALLRLYPASFRDRFGDEMVQLLGDQLRDARGDGVGGTWAAAIRDLVVTAASERLRGDRPIARSVVAPSRVNRLLGLTGIAGGFLLAAALIPGIPWSPVIFNLRLVLFELGAIAVILAIHRLQPVRWRRPSLLVSVPAIGANAWHLVMSVLFVNRPQPPEPDPAFRPWYALAATALWLTTAAFGLVALRLGVVSRRSALVLTTGAALAITGVGGLGFTTGPNAELISNLTVVGVVMVGLGWMLLGIEVAFRRRPVAPAAGAS